jgi:hypothetical protein
VKKGHIAKDDTFDRILRFMCSTVPAKKIAPREKKTPILN